MCGKGWNQRWRQNGEISLITDRCLVQQEVLYGTHLNDVSMTQRIFSQMPLCSVHLLSSFCRPYYQYLVTLFDFENGLLFPLLRAVCVCVRACARARARVCVSWIVLLVPHYLINIIIIIIIIILIYWLVHISRWVLRRLHLNSSDPVIPSHRHSPT